MPTFGTLAALEGWEAGGSCLYVHLPLLPFFLLPSPKKNFDSDKVPSGKAQNSITPTFAETSRQRKVVDSNHESHGHTLWKIMKSWCFGESCRHKSWKLWTKTILTCRDVCDKVHDKSVCVALMEFNPWQCMGKVGDKVRGLCHGQKSWKSVTLFVSWIFVICLRDKGSIMEFGLNQTHAKVWLIKRHFCKMTRVGIKHDGQMGRMTGNSGWPAHRLV